MKVRIDDAISEIVWRRDSSRPQDNIMTPMVLVSFDPKASNYNSSNYDWAPRTSELLQILWKLFPICPEIHEYVKYIGPVFGGDPMIEK